MDTPSKTAFNCVIAICSAGVRQTPYLGKFFEVGDVACEPLCLIGQRNPCLWVAQQVVLMTLLGWGGVPWPSDSNVVLVHLCGNRAPSPHLPLGARAYPRLDVVHRDGTFCRCKECWEGAGFGCHAEVG